MEEGRYHRILEDPDFEFWRNFDWNHDYIIREGSKYSKIKISKTLKNRAKFFKARLKKKGYKVYGPIITAKFLIFYYRKM